MRFTREDYEKAIADLRDGMTQLEPDGRECAVCGDSDHQAFECRHNPLVVMRNFDADQLRWRCFHCGAVFTDEALAREHFGSMSADYAACQLAGDPGDGLEAWRAFHRQLAEVGTTP